MTRKRGVWLGLVLSGIAAMPLFGCGMVRDRGSVQYALRPADAAPAATGQIKVKQEEQNQDLRIEVAHLPPPELLHPSLSTFVVWGRPAGAGEQAMNLGAISVGENREGSLRVLTPYPNLDIKVTAETTATPEQPSQYIILEGNVMGGSLR